MAVRGPTSAEFKDMRDLQSVFAWAGHKGAVSFTLGPAGALTLALHGPGFEQITIEDFASCDPTELETTIIEEWFILYAVGG